MAQTQLAIDEPSLSIDAVVFDMDGLMLDTERIYRRVWQQASRELGYRLDDGCYARMVGRTVTDCERELLEEFGAGFPLARFRTRWRELWRQATDDGIPTKPGLVELLDVIEELGRAVAVATSSRADYARFSLRQAGLDGRFPVVVTGDQVPQGKPAPDIYFETARLLAVPPSCCVALEDSEAGVLSASTAGMTTVLIPDLASPSRIALDTASYVRHSLDDARGLLSALMAHDCRTG